MTPTVSLLRRCALLLPLVLGGCFLVPHKIDMQQGNYIDQDMASKLKADMTRSQVRFILGTPLLADPFHPNRWDYVFLTGRAGDVKRERRLTVIFDGDKMVRVEGDVVPAERLTEAPVDTRNP